MRRKSHFNFHSPLVSDQDGDSRYTKNIKTFIRGFAVKSFPDPASEARGRLDSQTLYTRIQKDPELGRVFNTFEETILNDFQKLYGKLISSNILVDSDQTDSVVDRPDNPNENSDKVIEFFNLKYASSNSVRIGELSRFEKSKLQNLVKK